MTTTSTSKKILANQIDHAFGKEVYLLGQDEYGTNYWLEEASWDCDWYWGFGYVETYYNNRLPSKSKGIDSHRHIDTSFIGKIDGHKEYVHNIFNCPLLTKTTFTESEGWKLSELFETFYTLQSTAKIYHIGGSNTATNPLSDVLKNTAAEDQINKGLLPRVFEEVYKILSPKKYHLTPSFI
jgi:hypothetical protein